MLELLPLFNIVLLLTLFLSKIFTNDTTWPIGTKLWRKFLRVSSTELIWGFRIHRKTWPPLLKIEHRGQTEVFRIYLQNCLAKFWQRLKFSVWWDLSVVKFSFWSVMLCWSYCPFLTFLILFVSKSSPLVILDKLEPNLVWLFLWVSCIELIWGFLICQKTWQPLLKIEHRVRQ